MKLFLFLFLAATVRANDLSDLASAILSNSAPRWLSDTRAFQNVAALKPNQGFVPYELNAPFWSDGASKQRWIFVPPGTHVSFSPTNEWRFPPGTLFMKQFDLAHSDEAPMAWHHLETRFTVVTPTGGIVGVTYRWRDDTNAELLTTNLLATVATQHGTRPWYFPSREDCLACHTPLNGGVLGVNTRQMNREFAHPNGESKNQLVAWQRRGMFAPGQSEMIPARLQKLSPVNDSTALIEGRARSWLDANCAQCHRPGGTVATFDARFSTPLLQQQIINAPVLIDEGIDLARVIAPNDIWRSILFLRVNTCEAFKMPPIAHERVDAAGVAVLREWIESLPGPRVVAPPKVFPAAGDFNGPVLITLRHDDPQAVVHFTLDGSSPIKSSPIYSNAIKLTESATVRARAFKEGSTKSIAVQETFIVNSSRSAARQ
ncbi:MAG TPA: chitobiase/beta-hexosaminidase C-terminal domain-containing protein [Verrucomicrobiae bacterium]|jgi:uncharacterized repeat protein (TIGR03806 family)